MMVCFITLRVLSNVMKMSFLPLRVLANNYNESVLSATEVLANLMRVSFLPVRVILYEGVFSYIVRVLADMMRVILL